MADEGSFQFFPCPLCVGKKCQLCGGRGTVRAFVQAVYEPQWWKDAMADADRRRKAEARSFSMKPTHLHPDIAAQLDFLHREKSHLEGILANPESFYREELAKIDRTIAKIRAAAGLLPPITIHVTGTPITDHSGATQ